MVFIIEISKNSILYLSTLSINSLNGLILARTHFGHWSAGRVAIGRAAVGDYKARERRAVHGTAAVLSAVRATMNMDRVYLCG